MERNFIYATCQVGAESAVKREIAIRWPDFRFAFSRPGFLTFRIPNETRLPMGFSLESVFARSYGFSLGKVTGNDPKTMARQVWELLGERPVRRIHLWHRDRHAPGDHHFEPGLNEEDQQLHRLLYEACPSPRKLAEGAEHAFCPAVAGEFVLDCIFVEPDQWWVGIHRVREKDESSRWPGGMIPLQSACDAVSRAWWKFETGLRWARFPIGCRTRCLDIGCAPGGASQALLARGAEVLGVDPADLPAEIKKHPNFTHLRDKIGQIRRTRFRKVRWILSDMNVAPAYTLDVIEELLSHPHIRIRGILTTLKLFDVRQAETIERYLERFRQWGFRHVRAAQLQFHRQEIGVAAQR